MDSSLIKRQNAIDEWKNDFKEYINALDMPKDDYKGIIEYIDELPSAQPERKNGKWILHENQRQEDVDNGNYLYVCSECGKSDIHAKTQEVPFCWWCGSEMREEHYD